MYIDAQTIITFGAVVGVAITVGGILVTIVKWFLNEKYSKKEQATALNELRKIHKQDMESIKSREDTEVKEIKDELAILSFCMLATLDGLKQLNCNGNVSKAYDKLSKHINEQAHRS